MSRASVVIVGGGISGLAAAWELTGGVAGPHESTPRIEVIEASDRVGGSLATASFAGRTIDLGADGFLARRPEAVQLVHELGLDDELEPINASGASIWLRGARHELPLGLVLGVPTNLSALLHFEGITWRAKLAARRDYYFPKRLKVGSDATIGDIVRTKLGRELSYQLIEPMIGGIQAGRIDQLSAKSVFPALLEAASRGGSLMKALRPNGPASPGPQSEVVDNSPVFYSLTSGVGSLPRELARQLEQRGVVLRRGVPVTALRRTPAAAYPWEVDTWHTTTPANAVVLATPAPVVGALLGSHDHAIEELRQIDSASAAIITLALPREEIEVPPTGTGLLVPLDTEWRGEGSMMVTAVTLLDRKWPGRAREEDVVLRAHVGRSDDARWLEMSDNELVHRVGDELSLLLPRFGSPSESLVQRWPNGLPQYHVGHELRVERARAASARLAVALCGNVYDGVGVPASIGSGRRAARDVLALLGERSGTN
ncbi:MAG: protoporphyrinogen oxidase [Acidimicrobiaceae bacterium]|nr:protoporphyrinogen oxidase [Acidimicrobiaceae bacterium]